MNGLITLKNKLAGASALVGRLRGSVSMANTIINGGASPYPKHVGPAPICSFSDGAQDAPLKSLKFYIEPSQDLHGYSYPWPGGGGVNKLPTLTSATTSRYVTFTPNADGSITVSGTASGGNGVIDLGRNILTLPAGDYRTNVSNEVANVAANVFKVVNGSASILATGGGGFTLTAETSVFVRFQVASGSSASGTIYPMLVAGTTTPAYSPYENICPISGWSQVDGKQSGEDMTDYTPITISLGQTVYGGYEDAIAGKLNAKPYYASYSGQTLVGPWVSSHDKYVAGGTPTTGAQVVDLGAAGTDYDLTPVSVSSLLGQNNIWCNTGDTELDYYPAAASVVAVMNKSSKVYTSIPLGKIRYDTYQTTPNQALDLDSYRAETGVLIRNVLSHTATKIEFNTPSMTNLQWEEVWNIIKAGFNNSTERKLKLKYYDQMSATYKTGWFYVPDVNFTIRNIDEATGIINYDEIRVAFIEY